MTRSLGGKPLPNPIDTEIYQSCLAFVKNARNLRMEGTSGRHVFVCPPRYDEYGGLEQFKNGWLPFAIMAVLDSNGAGKYFDPEADYQKYYFDMALIEGQYGVSIYNLDEQHLDDIYILTLSQARQALSSITRQYIIGPTAGEKPSGQFKYGFSNLRINDPLDRYVDPDSPLMIYNIS